MRCIMIANETTLHEKPKRKRIKPLWITLSSSREKSNQTPSCLYCSIGTLHRLRFVQNFNNRMLKTEEKTGSTSTLVYQWGKKLTILHQHEHNNILSLNHNERILNRQSISNMNNRKFNINENLLFTQLKYIVMD